MQETDVAKCNNPQVTIATSTHELFANLLSESTDTTPVLQNITVHASEPQCDAAGVDKDGIHMKDKDRICWKNVHPDLYSVYNMTNYLCKQNHTYQNWNSTLASSGTLSFPMNLPNHTMALWEVMK
eukprot:5365646-Ditylum_brightwellii.AAC.1